MNAQESNTTVSATEALASIPHLSTRQHTRVEEIYRHLHAHPELSMQEHNTAEFIEAELDELGVEHFRCGGTGVVGVIRNGAGPVVAFRADTDALPLQEDTGCEYASTAVGTLPDGTQVPVMHGCGHDTHMACLLGTVAVLMKSMDRWAGTLVVIFQPGEETAAGARAMLDDGLWDKAPHPEVVFGQHVMPAETGTVGYTVGDAMAMSDSWHVTVHGQGGHGSQPQDTIDPIVLGAFMITRIQSVVSREVDPRKAAVVTVGMFRGGLKENVIPASAEFTINVRSFDPQTRDTVLASLRRIIQTEAAASAAPDPTIRVLSHFPRTFNDPDATHDVVAALEAELGQQRVTQMPALMGSEDFGALAAALEVPAVFWTFGAHDSTVLDGEGPVPMNHSPYFAPVLEPTLSTGVRAATAAILSRMGV